MSSWDACLVDGVDLATLGTVEDLSGLAIVAPVSNEPIQIPGRAGAVFVAGEYEGYSFPVPLLVAGADRGAVNEALDTLAALVDTRAAPVTVTRRRSLGAACHDETALCVVTAQLAPQLLGTTAARVVVEFFNLDGCWTFAGYHS